MHGPSELPVKRAQRPFALLLNFNLRICGAAARALLLVINVGVLLIRALLVKTMLLRHAMVQAVILGTRVRDVALVIRGSSGVHDVVIVHSTWAVVHVLMLVFVRDVESRVVAGRNALLGRRVVLVVGHVENGRKSNSCQRR